MSLRWRRAHGPRGNVRWAGLFLGIALAGTAGAQPAPDQKGARTSPPQTSQPRTSRPATGQPATGQPRPGKPVASQPDAADPLAGLDHRIALAEERLRQGKTSEAAARYRDAAAIAWTLRGELALAAREAAGARTAFTRALAIAPQDASARRAMAILDLQAGKPEAAVAYYTEILRSSPADLTARLELAQALIISGRPEEAVRQLENAPAPDRVRPQLRYALGSGYLRLRDVDRAARELDRLAQAAPSAETYVLIGRTYRDALVFDRARAALRTALTLNPRARRAHYYLGMVTVMEAGATQLETAITEFREELRIAPDDPNANLALGMALVETQRPADALPALERAARSPTAPSNAFLYLGRAQASTDRQADAVGSLRQALARAAAEAAGGTSTDEARLGAIHYQLATLLRTMGRSEEAEAEFTAARRVFEERTSNSRERLTRFLADIPDRAPASDLAMVDSWLSRLPEPRRAEAPGRVTAALARACFNLGIIGAQANRFEDAAGWLEQAAEADPDFPRLQFSLGVAWFSAKRYDRAAEPLARALAAEPANTQVRRMLALARFNTDAYAEAVTLLRDDAQRDVDPSLQYLYGVALVRSGRASEAETIFSNLLRAHDTSPTLTVVLGMAYAQQGDHDSAVRLLTRALELDPAVAEANSTLGLLYLKAGRMPDAEAALRAELKTHPEDQRARHMLATVLDLEGESQEAMALLRTVIAAKPDHADARYLLGKILLARGEAAEAVTQLDAAVALAPEEANIHFQLAQALTRVGRTDEAAKYFETYQALKAKRRESVP